MGADVSKQVIEDAQDAYNAWREAQQGSYVARVLADSICRDILPALIVVAQRKPQPLGYSGELSLDSDTELDEDL